MRRTLTAAMGGLLSLGLGMSFISFIELGNFICNRFFFNKFEEVDGPESKKNDLESVAIPRTKRSSIPRILLTTNVAIRRHSVATAVTTANNSMASLSDRDPYDDL